MADQAQKKKMAVIGVLSLLLVAMVVAVVIGVSHQPRDGGAAVTSTADKEMKTSMKAITAICQPTDYKEACINSLSSAAQSNTTDPKELIKLAFEVSVKQVKQALDQSELLKKAEKDPFASKALDNCKELMDYSIDDLKNSLEKFGDFDLTKLDDLIEDLKVWLSGSMTYQETCLDGFEGAKSNVGIKMKEAIKGASELTSNALAMVDGISDVLTNLQLPFFHRRLLSAAGDYPSWISSGGRKLLHTRPQDIKADVVVAKDGSGHCTTINEALKRVPIKSKTAFVIYIKQGVYHEMVMIEKSMWNVMMIGDGPTKTKITGNKNYIDGTPTFKTATVAVVGQGFIAKNIGFENSAGPEKHQAVALRVQSDRSIFYNCQMDGYQDTLYTHTHRQFYRDCTISGTIDFIFGNAAVVFQNCKMVVRRPLSNQQNIVTAQGRKERREPTGIILQNCTITADTSLYSERKQVRTYLGRPWKQFSRTLVIQSQIDDLIQPDGWLPWEGDFGLNTCFYTEFGNRGQGSSTSNRVKWRGVKSMTSDRARLFTVDSFIGGSSWIKPSGVPFTPGLLPVQ